MGAAVIRRTPLCEPGSCSATFPAMRTTAALLITLGVFSVGCSDTDRGAGVNPYSDPLGYVSLFKDIGVPVGEFFIYDEKSDPNEALGQPGKYVAKATWGDEREANPCLDGEPGWECGGTVEIFRSDDDRDSRFVILSVAADDPVIGGFHMWKTNNAIVRVGYGLSSSAAAKYETALREADLLIEVFDRDHFQIEQLS
jgi:hypothetical protein